MILDPALLAAYLPAILAGVGVTVALWLAGVVLGGALGFLVALARRYGPAPLGLLLRAYVEVLRGTPFLVQLFLLYFGGPFIGLSLEPVPAGLLGLALYGSAYFAEIVRAGFEAVPRGHVEAAECVGLTRVQIVRRILIPEMAVLVVPPAVNLAIALLKETAILSVISVPELTLIATGLGSQNYAFIEALLFLAVGYWGLVELSSWLGRAAETRLARYGFAA